MIGDICNGKKPSMKHGEMSKKLNIKMRVIKKRSHDLVIKMKKDATEQKIYISLSTAFGEIAKQIVEDLLSPIEKNIELSFHDNSKVDIEITCEEPKAAFSNIFTNNILFLLKTIKKTTNYCAFLKVKYNSSTNSLKNPHNIVEVNEEWANREIF